jgi:hypothetical protein
LVDYAQNYFQNVRVPEKPTPLEVHISFKMSKREREDK